MLSVSGNSDGDTGGLISDGITDVFTDGTTDVFFFSAPQLTEKLRLEENG